MTTSLYVMYMYFLVVNYFYFKYTEHHHIARKNNQIARISSSVKISILLSPLSMFLEGKLVFC